MTVAPNPECLQADCRVTSPPSFSFLIFKPAASLIRPQAYRTRHKMQHSLTISRVASLWLIFGCNNFLCQQNSIFGSMYLRKPTRPDLRWMTLDYVASLELAMIYCYPGSINNVVISVKYRLDAGKIKSFSLCCYGSSACLLIAWSLE